MRKFFAEWGGPILAAICFQLLASTTTIVAVAVGRL